MRFALLILWHVLMMGCLAPPPSIPPAILGSPRARPGRTVGRECAGPVGASICEAFHEKAMVWLGVVRRCRQVWHPLLSLVMVMIGAIPAQAQNECGTYLGPNDRIICDTTTYTTGPGDDIDYFPVDGLTLTIDDPALSVNVPRIAIAVTSAPLSTGDIAIFGNNFEAISTTDQQGYGLFAHVPHTDSSVASTVTLSGGNVATHGSFAPGLFVRNRGTGDASIDMSGGSVMTTGVGATGLHVDNELSINDSATTPTARVTLSGGSITTGGSGSFGVFARNFTMGGATVDMRGGSVTTTDTDATGLFAHVVNPDSSAASIVTLSGGSVATHGPLAFGILVRNDGTGNAVANISDGSIMANGDRTAGVFVYNRGTGDAFASVSGFSSVTASGVDAHGIRTTITNSNATYRVEVLDAAQVVGGSGRGVGIRTQSPAGSAGTISIGAGAVVDGSAGAAGIADEAGNTVVQIEGTLRNGLTMTDGDDRVTLAGSSTTTGQLRMGNGSDFVFAAAGADISGITRFDGGDDTAVADEFIDTLILQGQVLSLAGTELTNWESLTVDGGSLNITDGGLAVGFDAGQGLNIMNGGLLDGGSALTLTGNLKVFPGSTFRGYGGGVGVYSISGAVNNAGIITTQDGRAGDSLIVSGHYTGGGLHLVDVDFATDAIDTITVNGDVTGGQTQIGVSDVSSGDSTGNDILVVDVEGATSEGDFALLGGAVSSGVYTYDLELLGNQWFLRRGPNAVGSLYESAPAILGNLITFPTLEQRVGQRQYRITKASDDGIARGAWLRAHANPFDITPSFSTSGATFDGTRGGLQFGYDFPEKVGENGRWIFGLTGQYGIVNSFVSNPMGSGRLKSSGYGLGATATWYGHDALYFDAQVQGNWIESEYSANGVELASNRHAIGYGLSVEAGKRFALNNDEVLIPQMQFNWSQIDVEGFTDSLGNSVELGSNESLLGRVGLAYERHLTAADGNESNKVYVIGNLLHNFSTDSVDVVGVSLKSRREDLWAEFGLGGAQQILGANNMVYAQVFYRDSLSSDSFRLGLTAGFRIRW